MVKERMAYMIVRNLNRRRICHIVASVIFWAQLLLSLLAISIFLTVSGSENTQTNGQLVSVIVVGVLVCLSISSGKKVEKYFPESVYKGEDSEESYFWPIPKTALKKIRLNLIFLNPFVIALIAVLLKVPGTYGLASVPMIVGHIFQIIALVEMTKYNKLFKYQSKEKEINNEKKLNRAKKLLSDTGKIFFINYYDQLKKYNAIDIIDIIKENYSEESKKHRIVSAKKIFSLNIQTDSLKIIVQNEDGVASQEIIDKAKSLLEKEVAEQALIEKQKKEKEEQIIPCCANCRYDLGDETYCKRWDEKPVGKCFEFKIKK